MTATVLNQAIRIFGVFVLIAHTATIQLAGRRYYNPRLSAAAKFGLLGLVAGVTMYLTASRLRTNTRLTKLFFHGYHGILIVVMLVSASLSASCLTEARILGHRLLSMRLYEAEVIVSTALGLFTVLITAFTVFYFPNSFEESPDAEKLVN